MSDAVARLRELLGADAVNTGDATWRFSCAGVIPSAVVSPGSVEGVADVVRAASVAGLALVPSGSGAHLSIGRPPRRYDAALSLRSLNRVVAHEAGDMTITVEAGTTLAALNAELARSGQWLPLDPPREEETTVGGLIAADRNGPLRLAYGKVRDYLIGITAVRADGATLRGGGRVVKNVAGYDLPKLFVGSFGTLGAIVEATFKVRPRPLATRLFAWQLKSIEQAVRRGLDLLESRVYPIFVEAINAAGAEAVGLGQEPALLVGCAGSEAELAAQVAALHAASEGVVRECDSTVSGAVMKAVRAFSHAATDDALVARVSVLPTALPALLQRFESEAASRGLPVEIGAHAGNGIAWCQAHAPHALSLALYAEWMRVHTREAGGWVVFEHVPPDLRDRVDPWGFSEPSVPLMVKIKHVLDPNDTFSPGRFVGGI